jgi:2-polyprenyl-3-methyl-5-hydroxy-6-metoxy-1,4-benzoquinol methylase
VKRLGLLNITRRPLAREANGESGIEYQIAVGGESLSDAARASPFRGASRLTMAYVPQRPMSNFDFGRHSEDYGTYRPGPPASFYQRLDASVTIRGFRSLDLATGPGTVALELGPRGSSVISIDASAQQLSTASRVSKE